VPRQLGTVDRHRPCHEQSHHQAVVRASRAVGGVEQPVRQVARQPIIVGHFVVPARTSPDVDGLGLERRSTTILFWVFVCRMLVGDCCAEGDAHGVDNLVLVVDGIGVHGGEAGAAPPRPSASNLPGNAQIERILQVKESINIRFPGLATDTLLGQAFNGRNRCAGAQSHHLGAKRWARSPLG